MNSVPMVATSEPAAAWDWQRVRAPVLASVSSPHSRRVYAKALDDFWEWSRASAVTGFTREMVQQYRAHLESRGHAPSSLNVHSHRHPEAGPGSAAHGILPHETAAGIAA